MRLLSQSQATSISAGFSQLEYINQEVLLANYPGGNAYYGHVKDGLRLARYLSLRRQSLHAVGRRTDIR